VSGVVIGASSKAENDKYDSMVAGCGNSKAVGFDGLIVLFGLMGRSSANSVILRMECVGAGKVPLRRRGVPIAERSALIVAGLPMTYGVLLRRAFWLRGR
jgi:hypothetical protein